MRGRVGSSRRDESLAPGERIRRRPDFQRCYQQGHRCHGRNFVVIALRNREAGPRLGMTVSRKVGGAVTRNRVRRRIREIYRRWNGRKELPTVDLVVHVKPPAGRAEFSELQAELERLLRRASHGAGPARDRAS